MMRESEPTPRRWAAGRAVAPRREGEWSRYCGRTLRPCRDVHRPLGVKLVPAQRLLPQRRRAPLSIECARREVPAPEHRHSAGDCGDAARPCTNAQRQRAVMADLEAAAQLLLLAPGSQDGLATFLRGGGKNVSEQRETAGNCQCRICWNHAQ